MIKVSENKIFFNLKKQTKHLSDYAEGVAYVTKSHKNPERWDRTKPEVFLGRSLNWFLSKCAWKAKGASIKGKRPTGGTKKTLLLLKQHTNSYTSQKAGTVCWLL